MYYPSFAIVAAVEEYHTDSPAIVSIAIVDPVSERSPKGSQYLTRRLWRWTMINSVICLQTFRNETRKTTRHSWQAVGKHWTRSREGSFLQMSRVEVPTLNPMLEKMVLEAFTSQIRFETADEKAGNQR